MRALLPLLAAVAACSAPASDTATAPTRDPEGWIQLFDGESLAGWTPKIVGHPAGENFADTFRVEDGKLCVRYDGYGGEFRGRFGHLFHELEPSAYRLRAEYRFVGEQLPDGPGWALRNSGLMLHGQRPETMGLDQDFPVSIEVQLLGGDGTHERSTANLCTPGTHVEMAGELVTRHCTDSTSRTYPLDAWVTVEVEVHGGVLVRHLVDGQEVLSYGAPQLDPNDADAARLLEAGAPLLLEKGTISLQSESHGIEFRRVELLLLGD